MNASWEITSSPLSGKPGLSDEFHGLFKPDIPKIEKFIQKQMEFGKIPGMSVVIVKGDNTIYKKGIGFANINKNQPVTAKTLFELGANSKAFTALGILLLEEKGIIKMENTVDNYIPWLKMKFKSKEIKITIKQLLHETSGIPFETIGEIPESEADNALEETVKILVGKELDHNPGKIFSFVAMNYDVLGLIIQKVSGQPFEAFMKDNILKPLGLDNTFLFKKEAQRQEMAAGYKIGFLKAIEYNAPIYRGNTPAGYFISNAEDMSKWLKIQLHTKRLSNSWEKLIKKSHEPDAEVYGFPPYGKGWFVFKSKRVEIFQSGMNPNFSSFIGIEKEKKIGVAVLANMNSDFVEITGRGVLSKLLGKEPLEISNDFNTTIDKISMIVCCAAILLISLAIWRVVVSIREIKKKRRKFKGKWLKVIAGFTSLSFLLMGFYYSLYILPTFLSYDLPLNIAFVWAPLSFKIAVMLLFITGFLYYFFLLLGLFFSRTYVKKINLSSIKNAVPGNSEKK
jgi:putative ATP-binding cassette transporter